MKKSLPYIAILGFGAFTGNMVNIGLSYGIHWKNLKPIEFMETFAVDFPLLLYPTAATLLPAFIVTTVLYFSSPNGTKSRRYWLYSLLGVLAINIQTVGYHLPLNLDFMSQSVEIEKVSSKLSMWLFFHWVRIGVALFSGVCAMKGFKEMMKEE